MKKKPGQWEFIATVLVLLACTAWAIYEYRQAPEKIPFEPVIATATSLIALLGLLGYTRFGKKQVSEKPSDTGPELHQNPVTNISDIKNAAFQSPIQAQKVHFGDVINYEGKPIPRALTKAPFFPETFLGREADLRRIRERLLAPDGHFLLLVNGEGGIGKTTLASKYYHNYRHEYAHTAWLLSEKSIANALLLLAGPLGLQFDERMDTESRLDLLLAAMADLKKPCLLVLDNANELSDLDANYQHLRRLSHVHLLLTTRISNFEKAEKLSITGLPEAEALALFEAHYRPLGEEDRALFFQIREAVGGNTLVLELLAKNLALFNQLKANYALSALLADLQEKGLLRLSRSQEVRTDYQSTEPGKMRREKPEDIIGAMYDLSALPEEEQALLAVFAVLPAESIGFETLERLLMPFSVGVRTQLSFWKKILTLFSKSYKTRKNLSPEAFERVLTSLAQKGWIEYNETETTFKCSPVVQEVTRLKSPDLAAACQPLIEALNRELADEVLHIDNYKHSGLFARYAETVVSVLHEPDYDLGTLCQNIGGFHTATGDLDKAIRAYQKMAEMFSALFKKNPDNANFKNGLAISYSKLGSTQSALGNLEQALTFFEKDIELTEKLYEAYPQNVGFKNGLAISYEKLGSTQSTLGNLEQALTFFEQYNQLEKELYEAYPQNVEFKNNLAISYSKLGSTQSALGNLEQALTFFEKDIELTKELYEAYPQNVEFKNNLAISYEKLGSTQSALDNLEQALTFFEERSRLGKELYEAYPQNVGFKNGLAISYAKLAELSGGQNDKLKAREYYRQAEGLWIELVEAAPQYAQFQNFLLLVRKRLADLE